MGVGGRGLLRDWDTASIGVGDVSATIVFSKEVTTFVSSFIRETRGSTTLKMLDIMFSRLIMRSVS